MASALLGPLSHDTWATLRLIAFVRDLTAEQRAWTAPGTYGSIEQTLGHIVGSEHYYVYRLTDEAPAVELKPAPTVNLDDLAERVRWCADRLERLCVKGFDQNAPAHRNPRDSRMPTMGGMVTQLLWHGTEHRAQIATVLGAHGLEPPDMSGWTYAEEHPPLPSTEAQRGPLLENPWDAHADAYQRFVGLREQADLSADPFVAAMLRSLGEVTRREVLMLAAVRASSPGSLPPVGLESSGSTSLRGSSTWRASGRTAMDPQKARASTGSATSRGRCQV